jgi:hypothetical protein
MAKDGSPPSIDALHEERAAFCPARGVVQAPMKRLHHRVAKSVKWDIFFA